MLGEEVNDPKIGETAECIFKKIGFFNDKCELQIETIKEKVGNFFGDKTNLFYEKCLVQKSTPAKTAAAYIGCFRRSEQTLDKNYGSGPKN